MRDEQREALWDVAGELKIMAGETKDREFAKRLEVAVDKIKTVAGTYYVNLMSARGGREFVPVDARRR